MPAGELATDAGMALASVSEHLKVLRKTGLAKVEKRGKFWFYQTDKVLLEEVLAALRNELLGEDDDG
jgi:DNA-binding transcriptional ArsR family regulator